MIHRPEWAILKSHCRASSIMTLDLDPIDIQQLERAVYGRNPVAWFEVWGRIEDKNVGSDPDKAPEANYLQTKVGEAVAVCIRERRPIRLILYKPRQQGCSTITVEVLYVLGRVVKMKILVIGGQASQTDNLWKILRYYGSMDKYDWGNTWTCNMERASCSNGTIWERETAGDKEAGRSGNYHAVIATELARWPTDGAKNASDVLNSVLNCVGDGEGTCVIMESTAQGPKGEFPKTWKGAVTIEQFENGTYGNGYIKIFAGWYRFPRCWTALEPGENAEIIRLRLKAAGDDKAIRIWDQLGLKPEQIKWFHEVLHKPECGGDPMKRDREYPTFEEDGFKASAPSRFDLAALEMLDGYAAPRQSTLTWATLTLPPEEEQRPNPMHRNYRLAMPLPCAPQNAEVAIAEMPQEGESYIIATDNGRGKSFTDGGDTDPHAVVVWKRGRFSDRGWKPGEVVASLITECRWDQDILAEVVARLSGLYGCCMVVPEANRGELLISELRKRGVMLYERPRKKTEVDAGKSTNLWGWETTHESKRFLIETLASHIRQLNVIGTGLRIWFEWIISELRTFVRHKDGTEGALKLAGCHDDFVIALAIAIACESSATTYYRPYRVERMRVEGLPGDDDEGERGVW